MSKGLQEPSAEVTGRNYRAGPIPPPLRILRPEPREALIEKVILEVGKKNGWRVCRSHSGNISKEIVIVPYRRRMHTQVTARGDGNVICAAKPLD